MGVGRGYGKLLLFGEHAAVYGHPAVGIRLEEHLDVTFVTREADAAGNGGNGSKTVGWELPGLPDRERELVRRAIAELIPEHTGGALEISGDLPMSVGFGSSAAFCTALVQATGARTSADRRKLWEEAHRLEHVFHGTPSGIDTGLSVYDGPSIIFPDPPALPRREPVELPPAALLVAAIPRTSTTAELVAGIRKLRERDEAAVERALHRLGRLSGSAASQERCPDASSLGRIADEAQAILRTLGLSTDELDAMITALHEAGAHGAKLSGAGGGGAFFGVFTTMQEAADAAAALKTRAAQAAIDLVYLRPYDLTTMTAS